MREGSEGEGERWRTREMGENWKMREGESAAVEEPQEGRERGGERRVGEQEGEREENEACRRTRYVRVGE